jgi:hypothetical protein
MQLKEFSKRAIEVGHAGASQHADPFDCDHWINPAEFGDSATPPTGSGSVSSAT